MDLTKKICIIGAGGLGREVLCIISDIIEGKDLHINDVVCFMEKDECCKSKSIMGVDLIPQSMFDYKLYNIVVAVGDPSVRLKIVKSLPINATFATIIHPSVLVYEDTTIGEGSILAPGVIVSTNVNLGKHTHLNSQTSIGHDCVINDFFTTAAGVRISGNCKIEKCVYLGNNACVLQGIKICEDVRIGMCAGVVRNIKKPGTYVGMPAKNIF